MTRTHLVCLGFCLFAGGCYTFEPVGIGDLQPEMQVRARLSAIQAGEVSDLIPGDDRLIEGEVIENDPQRLLLLVPVANANRRGRFETLNQRLELPHDGLLEVELRKLDRWKTGGLTAAGAFVIGYVLYRTLTGGSSGNTPGGSGGGPQDSWIPFGIPFGG
jgi:hypothetical protein